MSRRRPIFTIRGRVAYADLAPARAFVAVDVMRTKERPAPFDGDLRPEVEPIHLDLIALQELARK